MAQRPPAGDTIEDVTRESLIAISNSLPENDPASPAVSSKKTTEATNNTTDKEDASVEDFRSELISLSYTAPGDELLPELKFRNRNWRS